MWHSYFNYLHAGKWTPPCCLQNLKIVFNRVIRVLESCKVRYWLEGGTLLGKFLNSSHKFQSVKLSKSH